MTNKDTERLVNDYNPSTITNLTDGDSNIVYQIDDKYLYKKFIFPSQLKREVSGMYFFNMLANQDVPLIIDQGEDYFVSEYISGSVSAYNALNNGYINTTQVDVKVASIVARSFWSYKFFDKAKMQLYPYLKWEDKINDIYQKFTRNKSIFSNLEVFNKVCSDIKKIMSRDYSKQLTITHRDIHLDNILVEKSGGVGRTHLIDFEHCMEAPIEFEFQNSVFWRDEKSLNVDSIAHILRSSYRVPYPNEIENELTSLYFADQVNLAIDMNYPGKIDLLINKLNSIPTV
jgi:serine/threonine protein kinase